MGYVARPEIDGWKTWRDLRMPAEIQWYGWFIDYYMEGGLFRDIQNHKLVTSEYWHKMYTTPGPYYESGQAYINLIGDTNVIKDYDPRCLYDMRGSCEPALVVSTENILDSVKGPLELLKIAQALDSKQGINVIHHDALPCIWEELMINGKGLRTMRDRTGESSLFKFKLEHLHEMISELTRLKTKYSGPEWISKQTAQHLISILNEYILDVTSEIESGNYE